MFLKERVSRNRQVSLFSRNEPRVGFLTGMQEAGNKKGKSERDRAFRVLIVHGDVETTRLIRETLESFTSMKVESTPNPEYAFELAMKQSYDVFIVQLEMPVLPGELLYDLICKAYRFAGEGGLPAPGVVYTSIAGARPSDLSREARVKGVLIEPIRIEPLLQCFESVESTGRIQRGGTDGGLGAKSVAMRSTRDGGRRRSDQFADSLEFLDKAASNGTTAIKICGLTTEAESRAVINLGVDALGFNFWERSKRYFGLPEVHPWLRDLKGEICRVGVFVNATKDTIVELANGGWIDAAQLHGDESWEYCAELRDEGIPFIKAIGVKDESSLDELRGYATPYLLLDAYAPDDRGGTGRTFEWALAREVCQDYPDLRIVLSGGLDPGNVKDAVRKVEPAGVDVASGVEKKPGFKDMDKVESFVRAVW
ncbi:MAG: hypothetical protein AAGD22_10220 [Verrucomicrobiota bacterium]